MQLICKLNGTPGKESLSRLSALAKEKPEVFASPRLFRAVMELFETTSFRLKDRREIVSLFAKAEWSAELK
jgi:hypothetical protein